jgi:3-oxoacyl-(acyl-carrier-protein) synthase
VNIGSGIGGLPMIEDDAQRLPRRWSAQDFAVLHSRHDQQHDLGQPVDHVRPQGSEHRRGHGLHHRLARDRPLGPHDRVRRCRRDGLRRRRSHGFPLAIGGFASAQALSTRNDDPATASRPWDKDRDGFVMGEGAGVMVIEEYEHAKARGAKIYAELAGFGMSGDAFHMTAPDTDGPRRSMVNAMKNAGVNADQVNYVNAHGTSTPLGDKNETEAIKLALGIDAAKKTVVNSTKSMTGHLLGGAGGLESVFTVLAVHHQVSPPTINIFNQDPECDLDYCANTARSMKIDVAVKNNFGFGGTNGTLVFRRV